MRPLALALLSAALASAVWLSPSGSPKASGPGRSDSDLYAALVARVSAGDSYYSAAADELPTRGYATATPMNWRLPTLTVFQSAVPWHSWILCGLGLVSTLAWVIRYRTVPSAALVMAVAGALMLPILASSRFALTHELWAGTLLSLALGLRALGWTYTSMTVLLAGCLIRELAVPAVVALAALSMWHRRWTELAGWTAVFVVATAAIGWHYMTVLPLITADAIRDQWLWQGGLSFAARAVRVNTLMAVAPLWLSAALIPWIVVGLWRADRRVGVVVAGYLVAFAVAGRHDNWYWGFLIGPILPVSIAGFWTSSRSSTATPNWS